MARKLTREDILDLIFDSDAESDSGSDSLSDSDEEARLPENLAGCYRSNEPAIPDNAIYASEGAVFLPTWTSDLFSPPDLDFDNTGKGVQDSQTNPSEADCFKLFMNKPIVEQVVQETNRYAYQLKESATVPGKQNGLTTVNEIYTFLAAVIVMGLVRKGSLKDYWTTDPLTQTPFFPTLFPLDRFQVLLRALHFADNTTANLRDPLNKIRSVFTSLMATFGQMFVPHKDLCIDESLLLWKGRLGFRQYIPSKRKRFGIKLFMLCDVLTGYIINVKVYTGSNTDITHTPGLGVSGSVVLTLLEPYLGRGHTLYVDNWYTSPTLFHHLLRAKTGACGTVRSNRKGMPRFRDKMCSGEAEFKSCKDMLAVKWHDRRDVHMLTTVHSANMSPSGKIDHATGNQKIKPQCVLDYNKKMGAVDKVDMMDSFVGCTRKTLKWYKKLFFHFVDLAVHNAFIVYKKKQDSSLTYQKFRQNLVRQLVEEHHTPRKPSTGGRPPADNPLRLTGWHFPSEIPSTAQQGKNTRRHCKVCLTTKKSLQKKQKTRFMCKPCNAALCPALRNASMSVSDVDNSEDTHIHMP
ncbi:piggyBac transposable element-derived protein 4-like [Chanodichthys erythropterus]|uniref:piggyBac transposable element-derived protein 4-like n=1 Tax=Chanodichthys erythropterus TaxID=933992 RepID=UPI00351F6D9D